MKNVRVTNEWHQTSKSADSYGNQKLNQQVGQEVLREELVKEEVLHPAQWKSWPGKFG